MRPLETRFRAVPRPGVQAAGAARQKGRRRSACGGPDPGDTSKSRGGGSRRESRATCPAAARSRRRNTHRDVPLPRADQSVRQPALGVRAAVVQHCVTSPRTARDCRDPLSNVHAHPRSRREEGAARRRRRKRPEHDAVDAVAPDRRNAFQQRPRPRNCRRAQRGRRRAGALGREPARSARMPGPAISGATRSTETTSTRGIAGS